MQRRSLREVLADRRAARATRRSGPPVPLVDPRGDPWIIAWLAAAPSANPPQWRGEERDRDLKDDFGGSWHTYRERAEHLRQAHGWAVPQPPPRAEPWMPLGRNDGQERDNDREDR